MRRAFVYPRARWLTGVALQDLVLVAMLVIVLAWRPPGLLAIVLGIAIPVVLAWGFATLHFPSRVTIDDDGIAFHAYGRAHRFAWREVRAVRVRRFLVRDRVLVRLLPAPPWRGRYWILSSIEGFEQLVAELAHREAMRE